MDFKKELLDAIESTDLARLDDALLNYIRSIDSSEDDNLCTTVQLTMDCLHYQLVILRNFLRQK